MPVDYESLDSLTNALQGHEAVVSTISGAAGASQLRLVEAAAKAGVRRFIPSEFGSDTLNEKSRALPVFKDKVTVIEALQKEAANGSGLTYTLIFTGPFLDWGITLGFIVNIKEKQIDLYDGGDRLFSATTLASIGKAVVGVLKHPEETKNRAVRVHDTTTTLKKLLTQAKEATGAEGWTENVVYTKDLLETAWAELKKDEPDRHLFIFNFIKTSVWGEGYGGHFEKVDNELLGIREWSDADVQALLKTLAKQER